MRGVTVIIAAAALLIVVLGLLAKTRHGWYLRKAKKVLRRLDAGGMTSGQKLAYLRKSNPFVFEELVLLGFGRHGFRSIRNRRYTGDGGIDGRVVKDGVTYLVQCKRYSGHIDAAHVRAFVELCERQHGGGFFVHTGRTGEKSREVAMDSGRVVTFVSGERLVELLGRP